MEKSINFDAYNNLREGRRSTTPQQKNKFMYSNLIDQQ